MKKTSIVFSAAFLLLGSSLAPAIASSHAATSASLLVLDNPPSRDQGKAAAVAWYTSTNPTKDQLEEQYQMAIDNRLEAEAGSDEYYYWTGYQFQLYTYR